MATKPAAEIQLMRSAFGKALPSVILLSAPAMLVCADLTSQSGHEDAQTSSAVPLRRQYFLAK